MLFGGATIDGSSADVQHAVGTQKRNPGAILERFENREEVERYLLEIDRPDWKAETIG